jgi:CubicO group peptidase (beta-lactamase class C family)
LPRAQDGEIRREAITVQNLLDMTSGIVWKELENGTAYWSLLREMTRSPDCVKFILYRPMSSAPGDEFNYNSGNQHLLSAILTKLTGMGTLEYAKAKLFDPLGIKDLYWWHDPQGITIGGYGLFLQPRSFRRVPEDRLEAACPTRQRTVRWCPARHYTMGR